MSTLASQIERIVLDRIAQDRLKIPAIPAIAAQAIGLLRDPNVAVKRLTTLIEHDAILSARVLRAASSAAYGSAVASLQIAVTRLGLAKLRSLVTEHAAQALFTSRDPRIVTVAQAVWRHSRATALVARDLISLGGDADQAEVAYMGGLLHDIGKVIGAAMLLEAERHLGRTGWVGADQWLDTLRAIHRPIGLALAGKWELAPEVVAVIRDCTEYDNADRGSPTNYVRFANALAKREGIYEGPVDREDVAASLLIGRSLLALDDEVTERITQGLVARIDDATVH